MRFLDDSRYGWKTYRAGGVTVRHFGREESVRQLVDALPQDRAPERDDLARKLAALPGHWAFVAEGPGWWLAAVDTVRSIPLFHGTHDGETVVSNHAQAVRKELSAEVSGPAPFLEFFLSGYVSGRDTLARGVHQLQAGEMLFAEDGAEGVPSRYYRFWDKPDGSRSHEALVAELGEATDAIFDRLVDDLAGRPVWVPLSAGLDSRLILLKLHERGCPAVQTFSYGVPGNHEAKHAKSIAQELGVPWLFVPTTGEMMRKFQQSEDRLRYWEFCTGLSSVPNPQDIVALMQLRREGRIPAEAVIVNGQSGDFISGNHIPPHLIHADAAADALFETAFAKHFALWTDMQAPASKAMVRERFETLTAEFGVPSDIPGRMALLHDCWEWQERQAKYVVNGQRIYDFLGFDWYLPLWDIEYMHFWPTVPLENRVGQALYKDYLRQWNYKGLFTRDFPPVRHWPGARFSLFLLAQVVGLAGRKAKDAYYRYVRYLGHYGYQWQSYPLGHFLKRTQHARNVMSFYTETWADENIGEGTRQRILRQVSD